MHIGIQLPATVETGNAAELGRVIEDLGFESYFVGEHVAIPAEFRSSAPGSHQGNLPEHFGRWMDPFLVLAAVAGATRHIKLGTGLCLPALRPALVVAKEVATLDVLSQGRLTLGVGAGWMREEYEAVGVPYGQRWKRLGETVEAMRLLWREPKASYSGEYVRFPPVRCEPKPVQPGGPPILLGAGGTALGGNPRALARVARTYDGWLPVASEPSDMAADIGKLRELLRQNGKDPGSLIVTALFAAPAGTATRDRLAQLQDAGVQRLILHERSDVIAMASGKADVSEIVKRLSAVVERAQTV